MQNKYFVSGIIFASLLSLSACDYVPDWMGGRKDNTPSLPGERIEVLPKQSGIIPDEKLVSIPVILPDPMQHKDWPQHSGYFTPTTSNIAMPETLIQSQETSIGEGEAFEYALVPRPVVAGGNGVCHGC